MAVKVLIGKKAQLSKKDALNEGIGSAFKVFWNELVGGIDPQELGNNGLVTLIPTSPSLFMRKYSERDVPPQ